MAKTSAMPGWQLALHVDRHNGRRHRRCLSVLGEDGFYYCRAKAYPEKALAGT
jgi:hypothetical protein